MTWIALIKSALEGLGSIRFIWEKIDRMNVEAHMQKLYERQQLLAEAMLEMASADLPQERKDALKKMASSWKS